MLERESIEGEEQKNSVELGFEPKGPSLHLFIDITLFSAAIKAYINSVNAKRRGEEIQRILNLWHWHEHYIDKKTKRRVLSELPKIEHEQGSAQASRVVIDIVSDINSSTVIQGLRSGCYKNSLLAEVLLIYRRRFYRLPKSLIMSKRIFDILKSEKGYT